MNEVSQQTRGDGPDFKRALTVSIVLFQANNEVLINTLRSLGRSICNARIAQAEVRLTDHSPTPAEPGIVERWREAAGSELPIHYDFVDANLGFGAGHNRAFGRATATDFFLVANPDLEFAQDSIAAGLDFMAANPGAGLVAPALIEDDGSLRPACFAAPDLITLAQRALGLSARDSARIFRYECRDMNPLAPIFNPACTSGCCMLFHTTTYQCLGGFDPGYFLYFEDFDLSWRAGRLGQSAYCPAMRVRHFGGGASRKGWRHKWYFLRSAMRFFNVHGWRWH